MTVKLSYRMRAEKLIWPVLLTILTVTALTVLKCTTPHFTEIWTGRRWLAFARSRLPFDLLAETQRGSNALESCTAYVAYVHRWIAVC